MTEQSIAQKWAFANDLPPQEILNEILDYDPATGILRWNVRAGTSQPTKRFNTLFAGKVAGYEHQGYILVKIFGTDYMAHRVIWKMLHGSDPLDRLDHEDTDKTNNRQKNLREATASQNKQNRGRDTRNKSGFKGVHFHNGKWVAQIKHRGQINRLGSFEKKHEAHAAYCEEADRLFGEFARYN